MKSTNSLNNLGLRSRREYKSEERSLVFLFYSYQLMVLNVPLITDWETEQNFHLAHGDNRAKRLYKFSTLGENIN